MSIVWVHTDSNNVFDITEAAQRAMSPDNGSQAADDTKQVEKLTEHDAYLKG
jgi:hypothetical protein